MTEDLDAQAKSLDREYVFHSWSAQANLDLPVIAGGSGATVWDHAGNRIPRLLEPARQRQHRAPASGRREGDPGAGRHRSPRSAPPRRTSRAARRPSASSTKAPDGFAKVFFTNGGADANENAIRMARLHTGRDTVLSTYRSYHGNTGAAIVATGDWRRMPNQYARGHAHFFGPYLYRSEFWATTPEEESARALHHLERVIQSEGPATIAAILLESVPGTAGILRPAARLPRGRARAVRPVRHHPDPRRGDGGLRPHRALVRVRGLRRRARPDHLREGRQLRLRAGRRRDHLRRDLGDLRRPRLPRRAHLQRAPAGGGIHRRLDRRDGGRGHRRERAPHRRRGDRAGPRGPRGEASAHRRGARRGRLLGDRARRRPRDPRAGARRVSSGS